MKWWQLKMRDADLERELRSDLELEEQEQRESGASPEEARYAARRAFGNAALIKQQTREAWGWAPLERFVQDLRYAWRQLQKSPGFTFTALCTLALGIGASMAIFGFVDAALLQPLPYANPSRIMSVNESNIESPRWPLSYPDFLDWRRMNKSFSSLDIYSGTGYLLRNGSATEPVQGERVSGSFFMTLGVHPLLGRDFNPGETQIGGPNVVILSYGAWLHRFGARRNVLGQMVDLDKQAYTIIGVLPRSFTFPPSGNAEFWVPINVLSPHAQSRTFYPFMGIGRLREGVTPQAAQEEMTAIAKQLQRQYGLIGRNLSASVVPLAEVFVGDVRPILLTLLAGSALLLFIACVNVAGLVLARSENRKREIAVRGALGASRVRLVRQFVTEGLLLAALGSLAGVAVAVGLMKILAGLVPRDMASSMPFLEGVNLNAHTGAFAAAIMLLTTLLVAATPALRLPSQKVNDGLSDANRAVTGLLRRRLGAHLVVVELAVAVVLLAGAGLLGKSLYRLLHVSVGFDPDHLATLRVMAPGAVYQSDEQTLGLYREITRRLASLPGVESVGAASMLPVECNCAIDRIQFPGRPYHGEHNDVDERHVSAEYLPTLRARLLRGRRFTEADDASHPGVAIINQLLALKYFPGQDPIGQRIANDEGGLPSVWEIVGVVDDVREGPLDVDTWPAEYFPINQTRDHDLSLAVRTRQDAGALLPLLVSTLHQIGPELGVSDEATMSQKIDGTQAALLHRFSAWLVGGFALLALILGVVGLYGTTAYSVSRRTREIGVRMALGAQRSGVYRLVLLQAGWLTVTGMAIGLVCSVATSMLMRSLLFGVHAWDAATLGAVALLLTLASLVASLVPARRAASVDPMQALRSE
jgi:macrolide transport system ATP-binding/permease protein